MLAARVAAPLPRQGVSPWRGRVQLYLRYFEAFRKQRRRGCETSRPSEISYSLIETIGAAVRSLSQ